MSTSVLSGSDFNKRFAGNVFVKLTTYDEDHNGYQFKSGLNTDFRDFYPSGNCLPGGLYFCSLEDLAEWTGYNGKTMYWYRIVTIPTDAQVYSDSGFQMMSRDKFKTDKFILSERLPIEQLYNDPIYSQHLLRHGGPTGKLIESQLAEKKKLEKYEDDRCKAFKFNHNHASVGLVLGTLALMGFMASSKN